VTSSLGGFGDGTDTRRCGRAVGRVRTSEIEERKGGNERKDGRSSRDREEEP
jgi:hypothetical protein